VTIYNPASQSFHFRRSIFKSQLKCGWYNEIVEFPLNGTPAKESENLWPRLHLRFRQYTDELMVCVCVCVCVCVYFEGFAADGFFPLFLHVIDLTGAVNQYNYREPFLLISKLDHVSCECFQYDSYVRAIDIYSYLHA